MKWKKKDGAIVERVTHPTTKRTGVIRLKKGGHTMTFFCLDPDLDETPDTLGTIAEFSSTDGAEVKRWLLARLAKNLRPDKPLEWKPVIEVKVNGDSGGWRRSGRGSARRTMHAAPGDPNQERETQVHADIDRYYLALTADKKTWRKLDWHEVAEGSSTKLDVEDQLSRSSHYGNGPKAEKPKESYRTLEIFSLPSYSGDQVIVAYTEELWTGLNQVFDNLDRTVETIQDMLASKKGLAALAEVGAGVRRLVAGEMKTETTTED